MRFVILLVSAIILSAASTAAQPTGERSSSIVVIGGENYYVHTVKAGETIYYLSRLYSVTEDVIRGDNPQTIDGLQAGQVLKIPVIKGDEPKLSNRKLNRLFDTHTVNQGETLYSISRRYEIPVNVLIEDNEGLDPASLSIGQKINIRKKSQGEATTETITEQLEEYRDAINSVSTDGVYHLVESGETLYGISRLYNVTEEQIITENNLQGGLRAGDMIKIPVDDPQRYATREARQTADSLEQIRLGEELILMEEERRREELDGLTAADASGRNLVNVSLLLPLTNDNGDADNRKHFIEFYEGVMMGLEDLKKMGIATRLTLYNTNRSQTGVAEIVSSDEFSRSDLIIGPVYEEALGPVLRFAESKRIPVVSPLAGVESTEHPLLFQMAPDPVTKFDKLKQLVAGAENVIYVSTSNKDAEFEHHLRPILPANTRVIEYSRSVPASTFGNALDRGGENIILVSCTNEFTVDEILAKVSSVVSSLSARSIANINIRVVGQPRWTRFRSNVDRELFFKLNLTFVTTYHADRGDQAVRQFGNRFIANFGTAPSPYAYRGFDAAKLFISAAKTTGEDFTTKLNNSQVELLQTGYNFRGNGPGTTIRNTEWALVTYNSDYTITVQ